MLRTKKRLSDANRWRNDPENNKDRHPDANPESRMNDNPPPQDGSARRAANYLAFH
jgi:hypothetical protein